MKQKLRYTIARALVTLGQEGSTVPGWFRNIQRDSMAMSQRHAVALPPRSSPTEPIDASCVARSR